MDRMTREGHSVPYDVFTVVARGRPISKNTISVSVISREGKKALPHVVRPRQTRDWQQLIRLMAQFAAPAKPLDCPIVADVTFYLPQPKKPRDPVFPDTKPDQENLQKAVWDALETIMYVNDSRITDTRFRKRYGVPGVVIALARAHDMVRAGVDLDEWLVPPQ